MKQNRLSLNDVEWGEFFIGGDDGIFKITATKSGIDKNKLNIEAGLIPYITRSDLQNGINLFVTDNQIASYSKNKGNVITIGLDTQTVFYQNNDFFTGQNIQILENSNINKPIAMFIIPLLKIQMRKFNWGGNGATLSRLKRTKILLPLDNLGNPNWQFMEDYIKQEQRKIAQKVVSYYEQKMLETGFNLAGLGTLEWRTFKIEDIFDIKPVKGKVISNYLGGNVPYISTSSQSNGLIGFVDSKKDLSKEKCISIDPIAGNCFYHDYQFIGRGGAGSAINLLYNENLNSHNAKFIIGSLETASKSKASYGLALNGNRLKNTKLILPVDKNGNPHWEYMSKFMQKIEAEKLEKVLEYIYIYRLAISNESNLTPLCEKEWREFWLEDIVDIYSGVDIYERERINGNTPYVTSTATNNGVGYFINNTNKTLEKECISINRNGSVGYAFYHPYYALYGNDTRKLKLKNKDKFVSLFITGVLLQQKEKYGYGYKMGTARLKRQKIFLPVDNNENLDYDYMKKYMQIQEIKKYYDLISYYNRQL